ncbi:sulfur carrier protein ThiS [Gordonia caeni]|uniref:sulfur carrier protein ThiS n=1 Tax=Gordonia caeni TaxID=1007097 RepID=UPI003CD07700
MELTVNGSPVTLDAAAGVTGLLAQLGLPDCGVAVAVDGVVRPQGRWDLPIADGAVVDVLTAVQGG